jgi:hypothetical protein
MLCPYGYNKSHADRIGMQDLFRKGRGEAAQEVSDLFPIHVRAVRIFFWRPLFLQQGMRRLLLFRQRGF